MQSYRVRIWVALIGLTALGLTGYLMASPPGSRGPHQNFRVPSPSMEPILLTGDFISARALPRLVRPAIDQVVVYLSVEEEGLQAIKRVVGLPGDTLSMTAGTLHRNGMSVEEPWIQHIDPLKSETREYRLKMKEVQLPMFLGADTSAYQPDLSSWGPILVPAGSVFVLGDNRELSYDSRYFGPLPIGNIMAQPDFIYWSMDHEAYSLNPFGKIRWSRIGLTLLHPAP